MYELVIIMLVGAACDMQGFYQDEMPDAIVACSDFLSLGLTIAYWQPFIDRTDYRIVYVVDDRALVPDAFNEQGYKLTSNGIAYPTMDYAIAYRYVHVVQHELAHLLCGVGCGHGPEWELILARLSA